MLYVVIWLYATDEKPKVKKADRNGDQFSNGEQPLRQSIDGPREPGARKKQVSLSRSLT